MAVLLCIGGGASGEERGTNGGTMRVRVCTHIAFHVHNTRVRRVRVSTSTPRAQTDVRRCRRRRRRFGRCEQSTHKHTLAAAVKNESSVRV